MGAIQEWYVDPSLSGDSGTGTSGDPFSNLQYGLNQKSHNTTDGTRWNIKAGAEDTLGATLSFVSYGTSTFTAAAPLIIQGYTSSAGDGGIGVINGAASYEMINDASMDGVFIIDMKLHNFGTNRVFNLDNYIQCINSEFTDYGGRGVEVDRFGYFFNCYFHNANQNAIYGVDSIKVRRCRFANGTKDFTLAIRGGPESVILDNVFDLDGSTDAIQVSNFGWVEGNSIYATTGGGTAIEAVGENTRILNNVIEGFSSSGVAISVSKPLEIGGNHLYDNSTNYSWTDETRAKDWGDNEDRTTGDSPFTDASSDDFTPADVGNMSEGSKPGKVGLA